MIRESYLYLKYSFCFPVYCSHSLYDVRSGCDLWSSFAKVGLGNVNQDLVWHLVEIWPKVFNKWKLLCKISTLKVSGMEMQQTCSWGIGSMEKVTLYYLCLSCYIISRKPYLRLLYYIHCAILSVVASAIYSFDLPFMLLPWQPVEVKFWCQNSSGSLLYTCILFVVGNRSWYSSWGRGCRQGGHVKGWCTCGPWYCYDGTPLHDQIYPTELQYPYTVSLSICCWLFFKSTFGLSLHLVVQYV